MQIKPRMLLYGVGDRETLLQFVKESRQEFLFSDCLTCFQKIPRDFEQCHKIWMPETESEPGKKIGAIILQKISHKNRSAELIISFGEKKSYQNKKMFTDILETVTRYVFAEVVLERLQVEVLENNLKLKKAYLDFGFMEEGLLRGKYEVENRRYDAYVMSMLKIEWERRGNF